MTRLLFCFCFFILTFIFYLYIHVYATNWLHISFSCFFTPWLHRFNYDRRKLSVYKKWCFSFWENQLRSWFVIIRYFHFSKHLLIILSLLQYLHCVHINRRHKWHASKVRSTCVSIWIVRKSAKRNGGGTFVCQWRWLWFLALCNPRKYSRLLTWLQKVLCLSIHFNLVFYPTEYMYYAFQYTHLKYRRPYLNTSEHGKCQF